MKRINNNIFKCLSTQQLKPYLEPNHILNLIQSKFGFN
jgi:hypothetical protein